ncbi:MAG: ergothioneine biosynthesis protein EgtC, partial [Acidimicrobiia bacterium]|nr:ergothioneine biosynthesis protein EgtC [Acidimicrobiia bacterium]
MCRHLAYVGPPIALAALLTDADHSLVRQARAAKHQQSGTENPDGYGVGWWDASTDAAGALHRYRTATPIWADADLPALAQREQATAVLAAVRLASPGLPVEASGNAPFTDGTWLFSLNGLVDAWHDGVGAALRALVTPGRAEQIEGLSDSEVCFGLTLDRLDAGATPGEALRAVVGEITERTTGRLNFMLTDGRTIAATAWENSLFTRVRRDGGVGFGAGAATVASEPLDDDPAWVRVPDRTLVVVDDGTVTSSPLTPTHPV